MDLGIVTGSLSPEAGGLFHSVRVPAKALAAAGTRVSVYGLWDEQFEESLPAWGGLNLHCFKRVGPARLGYSPDMRAAVIATRHDVLHTHGIWFYPSYVSNSWRKRNGPRTVISPRGMLDPWAIRKSRIKKQALRWLYEEQNLSGAAALHALNEGEAGAFRDYGLKTPIAVIPNGVDLPDLNALKQRPAFMSDARQALLYLGRMHPKKGLAQLIEAWRLLITQSPMIANNWRVIIAGWDDGGQRSLEAQIREYGLEDQVSIVGPLYGDAKASALAHASAFVLPSFSEGMPMSILEAWSWRLPVFMTRACNLQEGFVRGAAFEVSTEPHEMAAKFGEILDDASALTRAGIVGRSFVEECYTWDQIVSNMQRLYSWVAGGGPVPSFVGRSSD